MDEKMYEIVKTGLDIQFGCGDEVEIGDKEAAAEIVTEDLQKAGYGNVKQAVKEFAEKLKEEFKTKHIAVFANAACNRIDSVVTGLYKGK